MKKFFILGVLAIAGMLVGSCSADDEAGQKGNATIQLEGNTGGSGGGNGSIPPPPPPPPYP